MGDRKQGVGDREKRTEKSAQGTPVSSLLCQRPDLRVTGFWHQFLSLFSRLHLCPVSYAVSPNPLSPYPLAPISSCPLAPVYFPLVMYLNRSAIC